MTAGIVSARGRDIGAGPYDDFLQIDAPVNRGNSGGPTFNLAGEVDRREHGDRLALGRQRRHRLRHPVRDVHDRSSRAEGQRARSTRGYLGVQHSAGDAGNRRRHRPERAEGALVARRRRTTRPPARPASSPATWSSAVNGEPVKDARDLRATSPRCSRARR